MAQGFIDGTLDWDEHGWPVLPEGFGGDVGGAGGVDKDGWEILPLGFGGYTQWENMPPNGWKAIEDAVLADGHQLVECGSDGACFFHSVVRVLEHHLTDIDLRNLTVLYMQLHIASIKARNGDTDDKDKSWEEHIHELSKPKAWVHDQEEIQATAHVIGRDIYCIQFTNGEVQSTLVAKALDNETGLTIHIARHNDHFKAVM